MVEGMDIGWRERFRRTGAGFGVGESRRFPVVCRKETSNIGLGRDLDIMLGLQNVDAVKGGNESLLLKRRRSFARELKALANGIIDFGGNLWIRSSQSEIIDLAKKKNLNAVNFVV